MKVYALKAVEKLIDRYINEFGGTATTIEEGVLGLGTVLLHDATGRKTIVIKEIFLSEWSSGHTVRMYNKMPAKYSKLVA